MLDPEPAAEPFGLADAWGLGLAVFEHGDTTWYGHDGNGLGTSSYLRVEPERGWVVAFTSNANTGQAMWHDLGDDLRSFGVPLGQPADPLDGAPPVPTPPACTGRYVNGDVEFVVAAPHGEALLRVDDEPPVPMTFHEGLVFSVPDPQSGRRIPGGRFTRDRRTGRVDAIQVGGRLARRDRTASPAPA